MNHPENGERWERLEPYGSHGGYTGQIPMQDEPDDYLKNHAILPPNNPRRMTTNELMKDLFISPSSSDQLYARTSIWVKQLRRLHQPRAASTGFSVIQKDFETLTILLFTLINNICFCY